MKNIKINKKTDIEMEMLSVFLSIWAKMGSILTSFWGVISTIFVAFLAYFAGMQMMIYILAACLLLDFMLGVLVTIKINGKNSIQSSKLRKTLIKAFFYISVMCIIYAAETTIGLSWFVLSKIIFAIACLTELWSSAGLALILNPDFIFLRLFKKYLTSEIAKKLNLKSDEVEKLIENKKL